MASSFKKFFYAAKEKPLSLPDPEGECYRLSVDSTWLRHRIVRVERTRNSSGDLVAHWMGIKDSSKLWGYTMRAPLEMKHWRCLQAILEFSNFWTLPLSGGGGAMDGAWYTVEAWQAGCQHRVCRHSLDESHQESFSLLCYYLSHLADLIHERADKAFASFDISDAEPADH